MRKKVLLGLILIVLGIAVAALPFYFTVTGIVLALLGVALLLAAALERKKRLLLRDLLAMATGTAVILLTVAVGVIAGVGVTDWEAAETADYAVVLGAQVQGTEPSRTLRARLDAALELMETNETVQVVVSGGQGPDEQMPEADCMYRYLVDHGADAARIHQESRSSTTRENLLFSREILDELGAGDEIVLVTSEFHLARASYIARSLGFDPSGYAAHTDPVFRLNYYLREVASFAKAIVQAA